MGTPGELSLHLPGEVGAPLLYPPPTCGLLCNHNNALMLITSTIAGPQEDSMWSLNVSELVNNKNQESHPNMSDTKCMRFPRCFSSPLNEFMGLGCTGRSQ